MATVSTRRTILALINLFAVLPAAAQTTLPPSGLETSAAKSDMARMCPLGARAIERQFTWNPSQSGTLVRDATPADNLLPRIEQHRRVGGVDTLVAVWRSFGSNPNTCSEPFRTPPPQPAAGEKFTDAQAMPFTPAELQSIADMGCGPFGNQSHIDLFRLWLPGDVFLVSAAVYTGSAGPSGIISNNNIVLHPQSDYWNNGSQPTFSPDQITIRGVISHGIRPVIYRNDSGSGDSETSKDAVEINGGSNDTIEDIGVTVGPQGYVLQAGIYLIGVGYDSYDAQGNALPAPVLGTKPNQTVLSSLHVHGFEAMQAASGGADGIFGDTTSGGTVKIIRSEIDHNGGSGVQNSSGPGHGIYLGGSSLDPSYKVLLSANWFHDQFYGHDAKSRAQYTTAVANYFQGGLPQGGIYTQAEAFNLDVPNGGVLVARDNVFVKNASGSNSNVYGLAYGEEGVPDDGPGGAQRPLAISVRFNTFVTFAHTIDGTHAMVPYFLFYPQQSPTLPSFPVTAAVFDSNAYVGYCPTGDQVADFRGTTPLVGGYDDMTTAFTFRRSYLSPSASIKGSMEYAQPMLTRPRSSAAVGARDKSPAEDTQMLASTRRFATLW